MKAAVFHARNVPASVEHLETEVMPEGQALLDIVAVGASHRDCYPIHGHRTPKEVMVYGKFLAS